jgi:NAD(P)-dependent dehydrogenase (short-subunit alcohol dehydrogenase family)
VNITACIPAPLAVDRSFVLTLGQYQISPLVSGIAEDQFGQAQPKPTTIWKVESTDSRESWTGVSIKNVIVTGAAGGMGTTTLKLLAERDVNVVCVDLDRASVESTIESLGGSRAEMVAVGADVGDEEDVRAFVQLAVERWGGLDGLFNIAGVEGDLLPLAEASVADFDRLIRINTRGVFLGMTAALPHLVERGGGAIVSTGSHLAIRGESNCGAYAASKHAIVGLTRTLAIEGAPQNVRANMVCPGAMDTRMIREMFPRIAADPDEAMAKLTANIPQGRFAEPQELAATGVWLLLDAPAHLTGQIISVDGGRSAG